MMKKTWIYVSNRLIHLSDIFRFLEVLALISSAIGTGALGAFAFYEAIVEGENMLSDPVFQHGTAIGATWIISGIVWAVVFRLLSVFLVNLREWLRGNHRW